MKKAALAVSLVFAAVLLINACSSGGGNPPTTQNSGTVTIKGASNQNQ